MTSSTRTVTELDSGLDVLQHARAQRSIANAAEVEVLVSAVTWAEQHPPESIGLEATWKSGAGDTGQPLAGSGAPLVAEFCIAEFAVAIGCSTDAGRVLIAHGLELKYRLPEHWTRVLAGDLPVWRSRRIAEHTLLLSREAAAHVDRQVAPFAHKISYAALDRLVEETMARLMPQLADDRAKRAADQRHVTFHHEQVNFNGTTTVEAELDLGDALDFDAAIMHGAETLKVCGSEESLDVRRAIAVGEIARRQLALDLSCDRDQSAPAKAKPRQVVLYVHLSESAVTSPTGSGLELARLENGRHVLTAEQVRTWCANRDAQIVVKPVIDLAEHLMTEAYQTPDRLEEQSQLRDGTCVFPWCARSARQTDCEHAVAYDRGGTTCSCNIAPLCRRHHRLKTHTQWTYTVLELGTYLWTSPHGYQFLRDDEGTLDVSTDRRPGWTDRTDFPHLTRMPEPAPAPGPHPPDQ